MRFMVFRMYGGTRENPTRPRIDYDRHYLCISASGHAEASDIYERVTGWAGRVHTVKITNRLAKRGTTQEKLNRHIKRCGKRTQEVTND